MFKSKIHKYLKKTGKKPYQLADMAGVPRTCIYRYLKGERGLNLGTAERIMEIIGPKPRNQV